MLNEMDRGNMVVKKRARFQLLFFKYWGSRSSEASETDTKIEPLRNKSQQRILSAAMIAGKRKNRYIKGNLDTRFLVGFISDKQD